MTKYQAEFDLVGRGLQRCVFLLKLLAIFPMEKPSLSYRIWSYIPITLLLLFMAGCMNFMIAHRSSIIFVLKAASLIFSISTILSKVIAFKIWGSEVRELNETLADLVSDHKKNEDLSSVMLRPLVFFTRKLQIPIIISAYTIMLTLYIQPVLFMMHEFRSDGPTKYILLYPIKYPYHIEGGSPMWAAHWGIETILSLTFVTGGCSTDNMFAYYVSNIVAQFRVLSYEVENMKFLDDSKDSRKFQEYIILKHLKLKKCCELLETIYGPVGLLIPILTALILCSLTFQISQMERITGGQITWITIYIWYKLLQAFLYAQCGEEITIASENFRTAVYESKWQTNLEKTHGNFVNMMILQRPVVLHALGLIEISAQMFLKILNTSLSYFFLLQTLND